jgi:squalene-hopene/tetraprenyl-beta-curcumene cyclase
MGRFSGYHSGMIGHTRVLWLVRSGFLAMICLAGHAGAADWDSKGAAAYLDQRAEWWANWKPAARDHDTFCISCHTALPYALGRPALRTALGEHMPSANERRVIENVTKRVRLWAEVQPFYNDAQHGAPKSSEARGTEAVMDALILASYDARDGKFGADTRLALDHMWALQVREGERAGAVAWLNFHNEPWEADDSQYWGATLAAVAAGSAPETYRAEAEVRESLNLLREYLVGQLPGQSLLNRAGLLWATAKLPRLLPQTQRESILRDLWAQQHEDGGWSASSLTVPTWKRKDSTPLETVSDGYATGLVAFILRQTGLPRGDDHLKKALDWLKSNQDKSTGLWPAYSLNKKRDPASDAGKFMSDAATAYSVLALERE